MSAELRDISVPYTEDELNEARKKFQTAPTYDSTTNTISTKDLNFALEQIQLYRTPAQMDEYSNYFDKVHGGRVNIEDLVDFTRGAHNIREYSKKFADLVDTDRDGFISTDEFKGILELLLVHSGKKLELSFEDFVQEADKTKDGKVSVDECANWVEKYLK